MKKSTRKNPPRASTKKTANQHSHSGYSQASSRPLSPGPRTRRTVLITVSGMSPAIVTETVWALAYPRDGAKPIVPDEVIVITTTKGAADLTRDLLTPDSAMGGRIVWETLRDAVRAKAESGRADTDLLQLAAPRIIELPNPKRGVKLPADDIRSLDDNAAAANFILDEIRRHVENPETRVIASIAGGRKTMGALLYACMTLIGRETDRITHVLVSEPFETCRGFFFPAQPRQDLTTGPAEKRVKLRARDAEIDMADIPFVPLRNRFTKLAELPGSFTSLVDRYSLQLKRDATRKVSIIIDYTSGCLIIDGVKMRMRNRALAALDFLLKQQEAGRIPKGQKEAANALEKLRSQDEKAYPCKLGAEDFSHELNHLRTTLASQNVNWKIPVRSLQFPPFKLTVR